MNHRLNLTAPSRLDLYFSFNTWYVVPVARQSPAVVLSCKCTNKAIIFPRNFTWRCVPAPSSFQKSAESSFLPVLCDRCRDILLEKLWTDFTALSNILCPSEVWNPQIDMLNATSVVYLSWIAIKKAVVSSPWVLLRTERIPSVRKIFLGWCWALKLPRTWHGAQQPLSVQPESARNWDGNEQKGRE